MVPGPGEPARFGVQILTAASFLKTAVRNGGDYGTTVTLPNTSQALPLTGMALTLWGYPADPGHDPFRGHCQGQFGSEGICPYDVPPSEAAKYPFLTQPSLCSGPLRTTLRARSWLEPRTTRKRASSATTPPTNRWGSKAARNCPSTRGMEMQVDPGRADSPAALKVNLHVPQSEAPEGLGQLAAEEGGGHPAAGGERQHLGGSGPGRLL